MTSVLIDYFLNTQLRHWHAHTLAHTHTRRGLSSSNTSLDFFFNFRVQALGGRTRLALRRALCISSSLIPLITAPHTFTSQQMRPALFIALFTHFKKGLLPMKYHHISEWISPSPLVYTLKLEPTLINFITCFWMQLRFSSVIHSRTGNGPC